MKKYILIAALAATIFVPAQFKINIESSANFTANDAYLYTLNGSKDILNSKANKKGNSWVFTISKPYIGMMKLYFPETNSALNFISENKDVKLRFDVTNNKINNIVFIDESNATMNNMQDVQQKKDLILPVLYQIKEYYKGNSEFGKSIDDEIGRLSKDNEDLSKFPFVNYYQTNYAKYVEKAASKKTSNANEIIDFFNKTDDKLETSSLLKPILITYLNTGTSTEIAANVDKLLKEVNVETPRGQTILSELIELFDTYDMKELKDKYLTEAKNLKCTINERLSSTIATNINTEIGAKFPNHVFNKVTHTTAKSIYDVNADKKIVVFWASTCSHCEAELPKLLEKYSAIKAQNAEIIALSLDTEKSAYQNKSKDLPWINDSELQGWYSSFVDKYNIHATPTYFVIDRDNKIIAKPDNSKDLFSFLKLN